MHNSESELASHLSHLIPVATLEFIATNEDWAQVYCGESDGDRHSQVKGGDFIGFGPW